MAKLIRVLPKNRPACTVCLKNTTPYSGLSNKDGTRYYQLECQGCYTQRKYGKRHALKRQYHKPGREYGRYKKDQCEGCNFRAVHACQLDVDHVDGNRRNNEPTNLRTLCANCHRLKTRLAKDDHAKRWRNV